MKKIKTSIVDFMLEHWTWSKKTFGASMRTRGLTEHIRKELLEIEASPKDIGEWVDVVSLAIDGFMRAGGAPVLLVPLLWRKLGINKTRTYPFPKSDDECSEHVR